MATDLTGFQPFGLCTVGVLKGYGDSEKYAPHNSGIENLNYIRD
jgi:hypothetical protein